MCDCRERIEAQLLERLKAQAPDAKNHKASLRGYALCITDDNVSFAESLIAAGKVLPAEQSVVVATLDHFALQDAPVEFADGADGDENKPLLDGFKGFLDALPQRVALGEVATAGRAADTPDAAAVAFAAPAGITVDGELGALHRKAVDYQAKHPGTDYLVAVKAVS